MNSLTAFFDGQCRKPRRASGGPGRAAWLIVGGHRRLVELGTTTGLVAEYSGLIALLEFLTQNPSPARKIFICGDCDTAILQVKGAWQTHEAHLQPLRARAAGLIADLERAGCEINLVIVGRKENQAHLLLHPPKRPRGQKSAGKSIHNQI